MNKTAIKNFAVWARNKLIADITYKAGLIGVSEKGIAQPLPQSSKDLQFFDIGTKDYTQVAGSDIEQRNALVRAIQEKERTSDYKTAFKAVIEEVAYTWFNRLIAIRFMEVNEYLPSRIRVLSSENPAKNEPDFVTSPFDTDLEFSDDEVQKIYSLKDNASKEASDELFRMLFIKQCNKLHEILPELFEKTNDYTELLLNISFTDADGVIYHLVHDIDEDNFNVEKEGQVEIIGWMYQYYNIEPKDETFALLKKNVKITKERIPAATQLFTPDWIVRYMVENSLGRFWLERNAANSRGDDDEAPGDMNEHLLSNWKYYLEEAEQEASVQAQLEQIRAEYRNLNPEDIKVIDPCMGSGHILVYCFDVLMQIYESQGYTQRDAAQSILENNLFGLDIDKRAAQLAYFAVMMKARQYDRRIFTREIKPHVYAIEESSGINRGQLKYFGTHLSPAENSKAKQEITTLIDTFEDAKEYGSILNVESYDWDLLRRFVDDLAHSGQMSLDTIGIEKTQELLHVLVMQGEVMAQKYEVVVTNPPYMGSSGMGAKLSKFLKDNYLDTKSDMSTVFMEKTIRMCNTNGYMAMINIPVWMFLSSYEKLREKIIAENTIVSMVHPGRGVFGSDFGTTSFVISSKHIKGYKGQYCRLFDQQGEVKSIEEREQAFLEKKGRFTAQQSNFSKIPGSPVAYWVSDQLFSVFQNYPNLNAYATPRQGLITGDNDRFLRFWHEVSASNIAFERDETLKWIPINKGGEFRRWYGNQEYVVNWENDGMEILNFKDDKGKLRSRPQNLMYNFKKSISWSLVTSGGFSVRYFPDCFMFNVAGISCFPSSHLNYILGLLNTKITSNITQILNPTINMNAGDVAKVPIVISKKEEPYIIDLVGKMIHLSTQDWDSFETSWNFKKHPLI